MAPCEGGQCLTANAHLPTRPRRAAQTTWKPRSSQGGGRSTCVLSASDSRAQEVVPSSESTRDQRLERLRLVPSQVPRELGAEPPAHAHALARYRACHPRGGCRGCVGRSNPSASVRGRSPGAPRCPLAVSPENWPLALGRPTY